ncbi:uncharacterized protein PFL1_06483 [Pseudozyma flocculosa PF-1]|uniref:Uncharacterized protein n=2 Tax=Pseudozyma flocculosa TaxID=84751 RepID=A0A5C3EUE7_9BASI|nr:uncharacterized protein PFL1_06483 [Pseudozyma flocculosa PF-1]EPQ26030.1 hypothetical protein PFL1_06483 [Pseudozyma flocculosa PF-1]SPO35662.1 uncharacterized protein PSFLO_01133 [Pseudozyma flocculosa]
MADASMQSSKPQSSRGTNPNTDYKVHYLRCKDKFDRVTTEQAEFKANISRASKKQQKLRDEIIFLLDAIAAKQAQRAADAAAYHPPPPPAMPARDPRRLYASPTKAEPYETRPQAYGYDHGPSERQEYRAGSAQSPPAPGFGGTYKRPRPPSADFERPARYQDEADATHAEGDPARQRYDEAELPEPPALKRARNH